MDQENFEVGHESQEIALKKLGNLIKEKVPKGMGFTLLMFDYGPTGNMFYISSAVRKDVIASMKEFIAKQEK